MWNEVFGVREEELAKQIVRFVEDEGESGHIPQPLFIVGSSGAGKSTILTLLKAMLEKFEQPYIFDGKKFFCSRDIIQAIVAEESHMERDFSAAESSGRKVVMIDNLDYYFKRSSFEDQYILRRYLNRESAPLLIATISDIGESLANYKAPFFEGIKILYVPRFDDNMIIEMDIPNEIKERLSGVVRLLPPVIRSFKVASEIIVLSSNKNSDILNLLDRMEPVYRKTLDKLPVNSQKILIILGSSLSPMSLSDLRGPSGLESGILSSYLRQLLKLGLIRKNNPKVHGSPYEICDKLLKLWIHQGEVE